MPAGSVSRHSVSVLAVVLTDDGVGGGVVAGGGVVTGGGVVGVVAGSGVVDVVTGSGVVGVVAGGGVFLVVVGIAVSAGVVLEIMGKNDNESYIIRNTGTTNHTNSKYWDNETYI